MLQFKGVFGLENIFCFHFLRSVIIAKMSLFLFCFWFSKICTRNRRNKETEWKQDDIFAIINENKMFPNPFAPLKFMFSLHI